MRAQSKRFELVSRRLDREFCRAVEVIPLVDHHEHDVVCQVHLSRMLGGLVVTSQKHRHPSVFEPLEYPKYPIASEPVEYAEYPIAAHVAHGGEESPSENLANSEACLLGSA